MTIRADFNFDFRLSRADFKMVAAGAADNGFIVICWVDVFLCHEEYFTCCLKNDKTIKNDKTTSAGHGGHDDFRPLRHQCFVIFLLPVLLVGLSSMVVVVVVTKTRTRLRLYLAFAGSRTKDRKIPILLFSFFALTPKE